MFKEQKVIRKISLNRFISQKILERSQIKCTLNKNKSFVEIIFNEHAITNGNAHFQNQGVAMASPLGPVTANLSIAELEGSIIASLGKNVQKYVDETFCYRLQVPSNQVPFPSSLYKLNVCYQNIQLRLELNRNFRISFLIVLSICDLITNIDTYLHWEYFIPYRYPIWIYTKNM